MARKLSVGFIAIFYLLLSKGCATISDGETKMSLYLQDISAGPNATLSPVAGSLNQEWGFTQFGTIFVTDDPITESADFDSPRVGRAQGMYVTSGLDGLNTHVLISLVFTNEEYKDSSLEIQGTSKQFEVVREVSVVSGTGKFRFARGYATFETLSFDVDKSHAVIRCNVTVKHF